MLAEIFALMMVLGRPGTPPTTRIDEVRDRSVVELLLGLEYKYEQRSGIAGFPLRAAQLVRPGECSGSVPCFKDRLLVVVATYDEYPVARAFRMQVRGELMDVSPLEVPDRVDGAYRLLVRSRAETEEVKCVVLSVTTSRMKVLSEQCPDETTTSPGTENQ